MKMKLLLAISLSLSSCAASLNQGAALPGIPLEVDPTIALHTLNGGAGHACPVNGYVVTARHVLWDEGRKMFLPVAWSQGDATGLAQMEVGHQALDLALLKTEGDPVHFLPSGDVKVGDKVYWFEFDFRTRDNALRARRRVGRVLRIVAKHIIIDETPVGGASGTCLLNEAGQVVGIVVEAWETDDKLGVGSAVKLPSELAEAPAQ